MQVIPATLSFAKIVIKIQLELKNSTFFWTISKFIHCVFNLLNGMLRVTREKESGLAPMFLRAPRFPVDLSMMRVKHCHF
jgi:hypothetical protein